MNITTSRQWWNLKNDPNGLRILKTVRGHKSISRTDISRICGLSKASVTEIVNKYIASGLIKEGGKKESSQFGGKRQILLEFNAQAGLVAGIAVELTYSTVVVANLNAAVLERAVIEHTPQTPPIDIITRIITVIDSIVNRYLNDDTQLLGIGLSLPGIIDATAGKVIFTATLKEWQRINIRSPFESKYNVPVFVENDVKSMTLAESMFGSGKFANELVYLWVGSGLGAGIFIDGKLYRGVSFGAGEVGYNYLGSIVSDTGKFPILYNDQGKFGEILTDRMLLKAVKNKLKEGYASVLENPHTVTIADILRAGEEGDELCHSALTEFATLISIVIINLINTLNPEVLILGGQTLRPDSIVVNLVNKQLEQSPLPVPEKTINVKAGILGPDAMVLGAVGLVLHDFFEAPFNGRIEKPRIGVNQTVTS